MHDSRGQRGLRPVCARGICLAVLVTAAACGLNPSPPSPSQPSPAERANCLSGIDALQSAWAGTGRITETFSCVYLAGGLGGAGEYFPATNLALVVYSDTQHTAWVYEEAAAHETGHAWDFHNLTQAQRDRFAQIFGTPGYEIERYAEMFMFILLPGSHLRYPFPPPTQAQVNALCSERIIPC